MWASNLADLRTGVQIIHEPLTQEERSRMWVVVILVFFIMIFFFVFDRLAQP